MFRFAVLAGVAALGLAACASEGSTSNPFLRIGSWFSYLNADDLRNSCAPGAPPRYRFVYNADYETQVRTYDVVPVAVDGVQYHAIQQRVVGSGIDVRAFNLKSPLDVMRGKEATAVMTESNVRALDEALGQSGFDRATVPGRYLFSNSFYWVVAACRGGQFHWNAYLPGEKGYDTLPFRAILEQFDNTGVAFNDPRFSDDIKVVEDPQPADSNTFFKLKVIDNGLDL